MKKTGLVLALVLLGALVARNASAQDLGFGAVTVNSFTATPTDDTGYGAQKVRVDLSVTYSTYWNAVRVSNKFWIEATITYSRLDGTETGRVRTIVRSSPSVPVGTTVLAFSVDPFYWATTEAKIAVAKFKVIATAEFTLLPWYYMPLVFTTSETTPEVVIIRP